MHNKQPDIHDVTVAALLEALPYIKQFFGKTVVIKYGGAAMKNEALKNDFATDMVLLKYIGMNPVVVHGGGPAITEVMERFDLDVEFIEGLRVTSAKAVDVARMVLVGKVNKEIVSLINKMGGSAVGLGGDDGGLLLARKQTMLDEAGKAHDLGYVGEIEAVNTALLELLDNEFIPVVASNAPDCNGQTYNINADATAAALAGALKAEKVLFLTDVEGLYRDINDPESFLSQCSSKEVSDLLEGEGIAAGMRPKLRAVLQALEQGVPSAHIIDGRRPHAVLLEILTNRGIGTKVVS